MVLPVLVGVQLRKDQAQEWGGTPKMGKFGNILVEGMKGIEI